MGSEEQGLELITLCIELITFFTFFQSLPVTPATYLSKLKASLIGKKH